MILCIDILPGLKSRVMEVCHICLWPFSISILASLHLSGLGSAFLEPNNSDGKSMCRRIHHECEGGIDKSVPRITLIGITRLAD